MLPSRNAMPDRLTFRTFPMTCTRVLLYIDVSQTKSGFQIYDLAKVFHKASELWFKNY